MTKCRSCGADVLWVTTSGGKAQARLMPVDAQPVPDGNVEILPGGKAVVHAQAELVDEPRFRSHFATCPQAGSWRK